MPGRENDPVGGKNPSPKPGLDFLGLFLYLLYKPVCFTCVITLVCGEGNTGDFIFFLIGVTCGNFGVLKMLLFRT